MAKRKKSGSAPYRSSSPRRSSVKGRVSSLARKSKVVKVLKKEKRPRKSKIASRKSRQEILPFLENVHRTKIKVIGVGGGGGNIVSEISSRAQKFDFVSANTDSQALKELPKKVKSFSFGQDLTGGLGCGMDSELGERASKAEKDKIKRLLEGSDICIFVATLGGGTGSGAVNTFAEIAQELHILCVGIFTMPFSFEGEKRRQIAEVALEKAKPFLNAYVVIPNEHIFRVIDQKTSLKDALSAVNIRLATTLEGFMETLAMPGLINIDFADVRSVLEGRGRLAFINNAEAAGATRAQEVVQAILANPLYSYTIEGADRILFNIIGDRNVKMQEVAHISSSISEYNPKARIIFGISCNARTKDRLRVMLFAVGCEKEKEKSVKPLKDENTKERKKGNGKVKRKKPVLQSEEKTEQKEEAPEDLKGKSREQKSSEQKDRVRRNALEVKKAADEELKELEQKERQWETPAFLRNRS